MSDAAISVKGFSGRGDGILVPSDLSAVYQFGFCPHGNHVNRCSGIRRELANDFHRECNSHPFEWGTVGSDIWTSLAWCFGIMVVAYAS